VRKREEGREGERERERERETIFSYQGTNLIPRGSPSRSPLKSFTSKCHPTGVQVSTHDFGVGNVSIQFTECSLQWCPECKPSVCHSPSPHMLSHFESFYYKAFNTILFYLFFKFLIFFICAQHCFRISSMPWSCLVVSSYSEVLCVCYVIHNKVTFHSATLLPHFHWTYRLIVITLACGANV
jgi:hypothetical protein